MVVHSQRANVFALLSVVLVLLACNSGGQPRPATAAEEAWAEEVRGFSIRQGSYPPELQLPQAQHLGPIPPDAVPFVILPNQLLLGEPLRSALQLPPPQQQEAVGFGGPKRPSHSYYVPALARAAEPLVCRDQQVYRTAILFVDRRVPGRTLHQAVRTLRHGFLDVHLAAAPLRRIGMGGCCA